MALGGTLKKGWKPDRFYVAGHTVIYIDGKV